MRVGFDTGILGHRCGVMYVFRACGCFLSFISHILTVGWTSLLILLLHVWDERIATSKFLVDNGAPSCVLCKCDGGSNNMIGSSLCLVITWVPPGVILPVGTLGELHRRWNMPDTQHFSTAQAQTFVGACKALAYLLYRCQNKGSTLTITGIRY